MLLKYAKSIEELKDVVNNSRAKSYLILGCVSKKVDNFKSNKNIIGALFPKIIFNGRLYDSGFVVLGLNEDIEIKKVDLNSLDIDFEIKYENPLIGNQRNSIKVYEADLTEIYNSRTFCLFEDVEKLKKMNLAKGGSLENAVVVKGCDKDDELSMIGWTK